MHSKSSFVLSFIILLLFLFIIMLPLGPEHTLAAQWDDAVEKQAQMILLLINQNKWEESVEPSKKLKELYNKNKWKYQLLGDEGEYEQLNHEIEKLQMAVQEKDSTQAKIILSTIIAIVKDIYSL